MVDKKEREGEGRREGGREKMEGKGEDRRVCN